MSFMCVTGTRTYPGVELNEEGDCETTVVPTYLTFCLWMGGRRCIGRARCRDTIRYWRVAAATEDKEHNLMNEKHRVLEGASLLKSVLAYSAFRLKVVPLRRYFRLVLYIGLHMVIWCMGQRNSAYSISSAMFALALET